MKRSVFAPALMTVLISLLSLAYAGLLLLATSPFWSLLLVATAPSWSFLG